MSDLAADAGRNLLFGLLAFQNGFIERRALLAAFDAWTNHQPKSRALGRILVEDGAISQEIQLLIDGVVAAHLALHDNQAEKSLAALAPIGPVRKDLEALADPKALASLAQVSIAPSAADFDPNSTVFYTAGRPSSASLPGSAGLRFKILRPLNKGGMGVVSVALDTELDRSIALKEIRDTAADNGMYRARFLAEAEITGKLEHPGIIPIYGLGTYADGRPFYAMRLIRGNKTGSLLDAINSFYQEPHPASRVVEFRGLLRRFLDVCNALAYAHSKGVLHRDLKPANILLGPYGETLVVDWGLAKAAGRADPIASTADDNERVQLTLSGSELSPTAAGQILGTPEYAPPEQVVGDLANVGPWSDVYGLGAVLYCLMTGETPFSRKGVDLIELIRKIESGDFPAPRLVRADLDRPLEAICLKAMARKPADRYESVRGLADDVERYLADEPVSVYREPWTMRARRWARKRRTLVSSAATALIVALVGLGVITAVQTKARNDLSKKNTALNQANAQVTKANRELTASNVALDEQRRRAEDREALAIDAVKKFGDTVGNDPELKNSPQLAGLRKRLFNEPLVFFRSLRDRLQADLDTRPESLDRLASASFDLSYLTYEIGDLQDALIAVRECLAIQQKLADANPAINKYQNGAALSYNNLGAVLSDTGKPAEAMKAYESALAIRQKLVDANPTATQFQSNLATSHLKIGALLATTGKPAEALKAYESAFAIRQKLVDANPTVAEFQSELAASHFSIGLLLSGTGKPAEALKAYESALEIRKKLVDTNPTATQLQSDLAASHNSIGNHLAATGKPAEALTALESALEVRQKLVEKNPTNTGFQSELAASHFNIGNVLLNTGKPVEAMKAYVSALEIQQKLAAANPTVAELQNRLAGSYHNIGDLLSGAGKPAEALTAYESSLAILLKLVGNNPTVIDFQNHLAISYDSIGVVLFRTGKPAEALKAFESGLAIRQKLVDANPTFSDIQTLLGMSHNNIAAFHLNANRFEPARVGFREAARWQRKALESNPANSEVRRRLSNTLNILIATCRALGDSAGAAEAERELAELRDSDPAIKALDSRLAAIIKGEQKPANEAERLQLAQRAYEKSLPKTAVTLWSAALEANPKLGDDRQTPHRYNAACAAALAGCGKGRDDPPPSDDEKTQLRHQARDWLNAEVDAWSQLLEAANKDQRGAIAGTLQHWKEDADLAGIRDDAELTRLPESERKAYLMLWADVDALLKKASGA